MRTKAEILTKLREFVDFYVAEDAEECEPERTMSKEPIRLTREEAQAVYKATTYRHDAPPKDGESWAIGFVFDAAEREAEYDPRDVQVGDGVREQLETFEGRPGEVLALAGRHLLVRDPLNTWLIRVDRLDPVRIVTRATPRVKDTVKGTLDGITKHGFVYESPQIGEPMVKWHDGHYDYLSLVAPNIRIVHRPEVRE